jgi:transposase
MLCGAAPIPASSGRTPTGTGSTAAGIAKANRALHAIALTRWKIHQHTRDYVERRTGQGLASQDIMRCLKRYVAREMFSHVQSTLRYRPLPARPAPADDPATR